MHLKKITQYSHDIAKFERDARDAAKKMEESFTKAQIAKIKMINVRPIFIAFRLVIKLKW